MCVELSGVYRTLLSRGPGGRRDGRKAGSVSYAQPGRRRGRSCRVRSVTGGPMSDPAFVQFTAHELTRDDLHALMIRSDRPALLRALWHFGALAVTGTLLGRPPRPGVGGAADDRPRLHPRLPLLRLPRDGAPHGLPQPLAERGGGHGGGLPHLLAVPELSRLPLGASSLYAGRGARPRALLRQAEVARRLCLRAHGD